MNVLQALTEFDVKIVIYVYQIHVKLGNVLIKLEIFYASVLLVLREETVRFAIRAFQIHVKTKVNVFLMEKVLYADANWGLLGSNAKTEISANLIHARSVNV